MAKYKYSMQQALKTIFPEHNWVQWNFSLTPGFWNEMSNQRKFMDWLGSQLGVKSYKDWYNVTKKVIPMNKKKRNSLK